MAHFEKKVCQFNNILNNLWGNKEELKSVGNFVAKTVSVERANQISLEELCRTQCSLNYFFRSHVDHHTYGKTLM